MERRMFMFDFARLRTYHKEEFATLTELLAKLGYQEIGLYLEGAFLPEKDSGTVREGAITQQNADEIISIAAKYNITVMPMTNVLYHMEHFLCQERYVHLRRKGEHGQMLMNFEHEDAIPFAMQIIRSLSKMFHTKNVHIGLDEFRFDKEEIPAIGQFISTVTTAMLKEGLLPGVWSDIFWMEQSLTPYLPREVEIYDWNYYGHRPESLQYFRENGFSKVIAVPSDNGWEGFIGCQHVKPYYLRARADWPVATDEIEAFFDDAEKDGALGGMVANWENTGGRSLWSALVPIARAGLWLQGKWDYSKSEEEQVEPALFGRTTPYTRIVNQIRVLQMHLWNIGIVEFSLPQNALYSVESMLELLNKPIGFWDNIITLFEEALPQIESELKAWEPISDCEKYAQSALYSVIVNIRAATSLMKLSQARTIYREAAMQQFNDKDTYLSLLGKFSTCILTAIDSIKSSMKARADSISNTGITRFDLIWQEDMIEHLEKILSRISFYQQNPDTVQALCAYSELILRTPSGKSPMFS